MFLRHVIYLKEVECSFRLIKRTSIWECPVVYLRWRDPVRPYHYGPVFFYKSLVEKRDVRSHKRYREQRILRDQVRRGSFHILPGEVPQSQNRWNLLKYRRNTVPDRSREHKVILGADYDQSRGSVVNRKSCMERTCWRCLRGILRQSLAGTRGTT